MAIYCIIATLVPKKSAKLMDRTHIYTNKDGIL